MLLYNHFQDGMITVIMFPLKDNKITANSIPMDPREKMSTINNISKGDFNLSF
jgi:hypothetical protein